MYGNGSGFGGNGSGFGIASLDPNACTEPVMKCPCETCRVMRDKLLKTYNNQVEKRLIIAGHTKKRAQQSDPG